MIIFKYMLLLFIMMYELCYPKQIRFPKKYKVYIGAVNEKGGLEGKIIEIPNVIPSGFEPDKWYNLKKDKILPIQL